MQTLVCQLASSFDRGLSYNSYRETNSKLLKYTFSEKAKAELTKHTVFTEYLKEEEQEQETLQSELYFDLSYFKANRKVRNSLVKPASQSFTF